jgi:hypothetical protein
MQYHLGQITKLDYQKNASNKKENTSLVTERADSFFMNTATPLENFQKETENCVMIVKNINK